jgi:hypothetical protein
MKIIKVTSCADCPYVDKHDRCGNHDGNISYEDVSKYIFNRTIHPSCPLENGCDEKEVE